jgi:hypothetical protein
MTTAQPTGDAGEYRYRTWTVPGPCPEHPDCMLMRCARYLCPRPVHVSLGRRGQPARFCSGACKVAEHRRLN